MGGNPRHAPPASPAAPCNRGGRGMNALLADPSMRLFALCAAILAIKMLLTANLTGILRTMRRVYATPEDYAFFGQQPVTTRDEQIERIRRAHQNDLENILPFFAIGYLYALSA